MPSFRSSRRVPGLKDSDYDHEINLVDHDDRVASPSLETPGDGPRASTGSRLLREEEAGEEHEANHDAENNGSADGGPDRTSSREPVTQSTGRQSQDGQRRKAPLLEPVATTGNGAPSIEVEGRPFRYVK